MLIEVFGPVEVSQFLQNGIGEYTKPQIGDCHNRRSAGSQSQERHPACSLECVPFTFISWFWMILVISWLVRFTQGMDENGIIIYGCNGYYGYYGSFFGIFWTSPSAISVGDEISLIVGWCSIGTFTNPCYSQKYFMNTGRPPWKAKWVSNQLNRILYWIYDCRSKGPSRDCPLQRPLGFQHETSRKFFSEFVKVKLFWAKDLGNNFHMRPLRKINVGCAKDAWTYFFYPRRTVVCRSDNLDNPPNIYIYTHT